MTRSWEEEPGRLEAVAASVGCRVDRRVDKSGEPPAWIILCPTRWHTVALLDACATEDARDPELKAFALKVLKGDGSGAAQRLLAWVQAFVPFADEQIETFIGWREVLAGGGDCDDLARLLCAMLRALGRRARLATIGDCEGPIHVAAQVRSLAEGWLWLEATVPGARIGEGPAEACRRLGVPVRADLGG